MATKPYKGEIHEWEIIKYPPMDGYADCLYEGHIWIARGIPHGHPSFVNFIRTSPIKKREGDMIETLNSRYKLVGEGKVKDAD